MKELFIIRHAKTERIQPNQRDIDRELNDRGLRQCEDLAKYLKSTWRPVDTIMVSDAKRTRMTYTSLQEVCTGSVVEYFADLYLAPAQGIMSVIAARGAYSNSVVIIGHNDGLSELVSYFLNDYQHVPTSGYLHFRFDVDNWGLITRGSGILQDKFFSEVK
jgi:phosphohistidine phosphatase